MTTPGKNFPGQKGFPTPNDTPDETVCRSFSVPNSDDWLGVLMGAVLILREEWAWYPWGSTTPAEAAAAWNDIIVKAYDDSLEFGCPAPLLAPFWDSATDVDDQADFSDQVWYGTLAVS